MPPARVTPNAPRPHLFGADFVILSGDVSLETRLLLWLSWCACTQEAYLSSSVTDASAFDAATVAACSDHATAAAVANGAAKAACGRARQARARASPPQRIDAPSERRRRDACNGHGNRRPGAQLCRGCAARVGVGATCRRRRRSSFGQSDQVGGAQGQSGNGRSGSESEQLSHRPSLAGLAAAASPRVASDALVSGSASRPVASAAAEVSWGDGTQ